MSFPSAAILVKTARLEVSAVYRIRRFGILKTATVVALIYMVIVAIVAIPFALLVIVAGSSQGGFGQTTAIGAVTLAFAAIVVYGILGWIFTAIACALYNLVAGWTGGIEVQVEPVAPPPLPPAWGTSAGSPEAPPAAPPTAPYASDPEPRR